MNRKRSMLPMFIALACVCSFCHAATENDWFGSFVTAGPDKYADGTTVQKGDYYAIVWRNASVPFGGFKQGTVLSGYFVGSKSEEARQSLVADTQNSQLIFAGPLAVDGHMREATLTFDSSLYASYGENGTFGVYLLDARKFGTPSYSVDPESGLTTVQTNVLAGVGSIQGYTEVAAVALCNLSYSDQISGTTEGKTCLLSTIDRKVVPNPVITKIKVEDDFVTLTVKSTISTIAYNAVVSDSMANVKTQTGDRAIAPVSGATEENGEIEIRVPRKKDSTNQFFSITRNPLN